MTTTPPRYAVTIPKQHGAWSVLITSFVLGAVIGNTFKERSWIILLCILAGFIGWHTYGEVIQKQRYTSRHSAKLFITAAILISASLALGAWLTFYYKLYLLLLFGGLFIILTLLALVLEHKRKLNTLFGESVGIIGLSLAAPATQYCISGEISIHTLGIWILCLAFFLGSVFHVRFLVRRHTCRTQRLIIRIKAGFPSMAYHTFAIALVGSVSINSLAMPKYAALALVPTTIKSLWYAVKREKGPILIQQIGRTELLHAIIFACLTIFIYKP